MGLEHGQRDSRNNKGTIGLGTGEQRRQWSRASGTLSETAGDAARGAMTKLLGTLGHRVTGAASVASARVMARQNEFDLLLSDLGLPDGSGLDLMRELKGQYAAKSIALTGYGMEQDIKESGDAGFAAHLIKPVGARQLEQAIHESVRQ